MACQPVGTKVWLMDHQVVSSDAKAAVSKFASTVALSVLCYVLQFVGKW